MKVVGAFAYAVSEEFYSWAASGLPSINLIAIGSSAHEVIELCKLHQPEVVLIGPKFAPQMSSVREYYTKNGLDQPLWIGAIGIKNQDSLRALRNHGVWAAIDMPNFTAASWAAAVARARNSPGEESEIRVITAFPTDVPNTTLAQILAPWPYFFIGNNFSSRDDLSHAIRTSQPHIVALGHQLIDGVGEVRNELVTNGEAEPQWVLMLSQANPVTLMRAAIAGITYLFTSDQFIPAELFAQQFKDCLQGTRPEESSLSEIRQRLRIAKDDHDQIILRLLVSGATNAEIATQVFLSEQTVKNRLSRMMKVASVSNRTELAMLFANAASPTTLDR